MNNNEDSALQYAALGWHVIPLHSIKNGNCTCKNQTCTAPGKHPLTPHGLQDASIDPNVIDGWWTQWPWANVGIVTGGQSGLVAIDIDPRHQGDDTLLALESQFGKLPNTVEALTGGGGRHILFKHPGYKIPNDSKGIIFGQGIDVRGDGGYIVAAPSLHVSGKVYEWEVSSDPLICSPVDLPQWMIVRFPKNGTAAPTPPPNGKNGGPTQKIKSGMRNNTLTSMAGAMRRKGMPTAAIEAALLQTNRLMCNPPLPDPDVKRIANSSNKWHPGGTCPTDDDLADEYIGTNPDFCYGLGEFRRYKDGVWGPVDQLTIKDEILTLAQDAKSLGYKPTLNKIHSILGLVWMRVNTPADMWNADTDLLVCKNGTLQISTRTLRNQAKSDYISSGVPYDYLPIADDRPWLDYLDETVPLAADFLQEFSGYTLTTDCGYEIAVWLYGPRGCGKSTFIEGLKAMLGAKAGQLGLAQLENSRFGLIDLSSKTLLFSTEQPSDYIRSSHVINALISGEEVITERKFKDAETLIPHAKICWAMNDFPRIRSANDGLFRRVKVVEFPVLSKTADPLVKERIKGMGPAILNWALYGLDRLRVRRKFDIPACVKAATDEFQNANDIVHLFVDEMCDLGLTINEKASALYLAYSNWCIENGHKPKSSTALALEDWKRMGITKKHTMNGTYYQGIRLKY